ncbi:MAG: hypothetical protein ACJAYN_003333, partial [Bermanella sp.]
MRAVRDQKWCSYARRLGCVFALTLFVFQSFMVHAGDLLTIENITLVKPNNGLTIDTKEEFELLESFIQKEATYSRDTSRVGNYLNPVLTYATLQFYASLQIDSPVPAKALKILSFLERMENTLDQQFLSVYVGEQIITSDANGGGALRLTTGCDDCRNDFIPNIEITFDVGARIQLGLGGSFGHHDVNSDYYDRIDPGGDYGLEKAIIIGPGSGIYYITYRVTRYMGFGNIIMSQICGTQKCKTCSNLSCEDQDISDMDRDGDYVDLKECNYPLTSAGSLVYPQFGPFSTVYLRICRLPCPVMLRPTINVTLRDLTVPDVTWEPVLEADYYEVTYRRIPGLTESEYKYFGPYYTTGNEPGEPLHHSVELPPGRYNVSVMPYAKRFPQFIPGQAYKPLGQEERCPGVLSLGSFDIPTLVPLDIKELSTDVGQRGAGSVSTNPAPYYSADEYQYDLGSVVTLIALPTERSEFDGWTGEAASCGMKLTCAITIVANMQVEAQFRPKPSLSVFSVGGGSVGIVPEGVACTNAAYSCFQYSTGDVVTLTPFWTGDMEFDHFEGDPDCDDFTVTINSSLSCTAVFKRTSYNLTITPSDGSKVSSDSGTIDCGERCSASYPVNDSSLKLTELLTATINPGFTFVRWAGDNGCWDASTLVNVNDPLKRNVDVGDKDVNCSVIAVPENTVYALTIEKSGGGTVKAEATPFVNSRAILICPAGNACTVDFPVNAQVTLTAKATRGSEFVGFESPDVGSDNYRRENDDCIDGQISMIESISCVATFKTNILVVNGADDDNSKEQNEYIAVLNNMDSVDYDIWHIKNPSSGDNTFDTTTNQRRVEPSAEDLANYGRVIWYTGNAGTEQATASLKAGPSEAAEASLASYLDSGGCLLMSGPEYFKDRGLTPFMKNYLGVSSIIEDVEASYIKGAGDGILGFNTLSQESFIGASSEGYFRFQGSFPPYSSDALIPNPDIPDGNILFTYQDDNFGNIRSRGDAAIAIDTGTYRAAFFGFPFLGISSGEGQNNTMRAFLDFCGRPEYDDTFEVNDDFDTASERFGDVFIPNVLKITAGNDDYFKWT